MTGTNKPTMCKGKLEAVANERRRILDFFEATAARLEANMSKGDAEAEAACAQLSILQELEDVVLNK